MQQTPVMTSNVWFEDMESFNIEDFFTKDFRRGRDRSYPNCNKYEVVPKGQSSGYTQAQQGQHAYGHQSAMAYKPEAPANQGTVRVNRITTGLNFRWTWTHGHGTRTNP